LPTKKEIESILDNIVASASNNPKFKKPTKQEKRDIIDGAVGLTKRSCANAFAYSLIENGQKIDPKTVAEMRSLEIEATNGLKIGNYKDQDDLLGYEIAKDFISRSVNHPNSKGVLLLGPPGVGKTCLAKWVSSISNKLLIEFELANVQGQGLYGQAEQEMKNAIDVFKSISNFVLFIDEIEKAIPKKNSSDQTGTRSFAQLLKFLSDDRPQGCYVIATCNNIKDMPPEWLRSERFDVIFFSDLPQEKEKKAIYDFYRKKYNVESKGFSVDDMQDWSGAEIKTACRLAYVMNTDIKKASKYVVPIAKTMQSDIDNLRKWAKDKTINASKVNGKEVNTRSIDI
jgi:SpoVK/Ycf46/Vps4 family AAA+-type ATPase